jgi:adenylate cyclase
VNIVECSVSLYLMIHPPNVKPNKRILLLFLIFNFSFIICSAQQNTLDSLYSVWQDESQADSNRVMSYKDYIWKGFLYSNPDSAIILAQTLLQFGEVQADEKAKVKAYNLIGISNYVKFDIPKALDAWQRSLKIAEQIGDKKGSASAIGNIGNGYSSQGNYSKALDQYQSSLKIHEEVGNKQGISTILGCIGVIYAIQGDDSKALEYYQRGLKICEELGNKRGSSIAIGNIGNYYGNQGDYSKALEYYLRSLKIKEEIGDMSGVVNTMSKETIPKRWNIISEVSRLGKKLEKKRRVLTP